MLLGNQALDQQVRREYTSGRFCRLKIRSDIYIPQILPLADLNLRHSEWCTLPTELRGIAYILKHKQYSSRGEDTYSILLITYARSNQVLQ